MTRHIKIKLWCRKYKRDLLAIYVCAIMLSVFEHEGILVVSVSTNGEPSSIRSKRTKMLAKEISYLPRGNNSKMFDVIPPDILKETRISSWTATQTATQILHSTR